MKGRAVPIFLGLNLVTLLLGCTLPEEKPKAKTPQVVCPAEPPLKGMVLATVHEFHLAQPGYPFSKLGDALDAYRPDVILVDMPQDNLKGAHPEDASIEIEYIKYIASTRSTEILAIGPDREDPAIAPHLEKGDEDALGHDPIATGDPAANNLTFEAANGPEGTQRILAALSSRARYLKGDPDYTRREAWLEFQVDKVMADKQPKRVLVIVDPINRPGMEAHLFEKGLKMMNPVAVVAEAKDKREENSVPSIVLSTWQEHLSILQNRLHRLRPGTDRTWLEFKVNLYQLAIDRHGSCCISLDQLSPSAAASGGDQRPIDRPHKH
jgi:hypothetical protein